MKTAISVPDPVFKRAERLARRLRVSRSRLFTDAVDEYVHRHTADSVTEQLNAGYNQENSRLDPLFQTLQRQAVGNVSQMVTLDKEQLTDRVGRLRADDLKRIEDGIRLVLSL